MRISHPRVSHCDTLNFCNKVMIWTMRDFLGLDNAVSWNSAFFDIPCMGGGRVTSAAPLSPSVGRPICLTPAATSETPSRSPSTLPHSSVINNALPEGKNKREIGRFFSPEASVIAGILTLRHSSCSDPATHFHLKLRYQSIFLMHGNAMYS